MIYHTIFCTDQTIHRQTETKFIICTEFNLQTMLIPFWVQTLRLKYAFDTMLQEMSGVQELH